MDVEGLIANIQYGRDKREPSFQGIIISSSIAQGMYYQGGLPGICNIGVHPLALLHQ
jgi:hypothetical protein